MRYLLVTTDGYFGNESHDYATIRFCHMSLDGHVESTPKEYTIIWTILDLETLLPIDRGTVQGIKE